MLALTTLPAPLLAVHISANVLAPAWVALGFAGLVAFLAIGLLRVREEEIARIGWITAALFVASSIHIRLGPGSVHLLLNGLAGVILGWRVCLAIPIGLLLQACLVGHGDLSTLGVNSCVMIPPALLGRPLFRGLLEDRRLGVGEACLAVSCLLYPWSLILAAPLLYLARRLHVQLPRAFQAGFAIGFATVFLTSVLQSIVLALGGERDLSVVAALSLAAHLPVALVEGVILGSVVNMLMKVKPSLLLPEFAAASVIPAEKPLPAALPTAPVPH